MGDLMKRVSTVFEAIKQGALHRADGKYLAELAASGQTMLWGSDDEVEASWVAAQGWISLIEVECCIVVRAS